MVTLLSVGVGIASAVTVVIFHSIAADGARGLLAVAALVAVTWSAVRLASDIGMPDDEPLTCASWDPGLRERIVRSRRRATVPVSRSRPPRHVFARRDPGSSRAMVTRAPGTGELRVVMLRTSECDEDLFGALRAGASAFLAKDMRSVELVEAELRRGRDHHRRRAGTRGGRLHAGHHLTHASRSWPIMARRAGRS
jgi:CheY-like chemotaxis protein